MSLLARHLRGLFLGKLAPALLSMPFQGTFSPGSWRARGLVVIIIIIMIISLGNRLFHEGQHAGAVNLYQGKDR